MTKNLKRKTAMSIWSLIIIVLFIFSLIGSLFFIWFWIIFLPLSFLIVIAFQAFSEQFWTPKKYCPRCRAPVSIYSEYCRNCGLQLIKKCPSCGNFLIGDIMTCNKCGHQFLIIEEEKKPIEYKIIKKGTPLPEKANFCPHCGSNLLGEKEILELCPFCGEKID
ncbi:MAG: hypothetical protein EU532_01750 [Promethearchaeota archaeon]|nr:MAG: hypothetical protein EU532_01750 [Candidatus Lokiarchaeota archaeon]